MTTQPARSGQAWTIEEDDRLRRSFNVHEELGAIVVHHQRSVAAIITRMIDLGLLVDIGGRYHRVDQDPWSTYAEAKLLKIEIYGG